MDKMLTEKTTIVTQGELDDSALARQWFIEMMENGDRCNPQDANGNLLESTDEVIEALEKVKGYISVPSFNLRMKPAVLQAAGQVIAKEFKNDRVEVIHGIPHSGNYLATAVAVVLGGNLRLHSSSKDQNIPASWKDVYHQEVRSFT